MLWRVALFFVIIYAEKAVEMWANTAQSMNFTTKIQREDRSEIAPSAPDRGYSASAGPVNQQPETYVDFDSGTEFSRAIDGKDAYSVWEVMDELLSVLQATNPRLFDGVMRKIEQI